MDFFWHLDFMSCGLRQGRIWTAPTSRQPRTSSGTGGAFGEHPANLLCSAVHPGTEAKVPPLPESVVA